MRRSRWHGTGWTWKHYLRFERSMIGESRQLVTDEPVEFEKSSAGKLAIILEECIEYNYPSFIKEQQRMSTCNRLDLQTLRMSTDCAQKSPRSLWLIMPKYLPQNSPRTLNETHPVFPGHRSSDTKAPL
jgi:hypothetical protein